VFTTRESCASAMARRQIPTTSGDREKRRDQLFEALSEESDRGLVLVGACFLEEALEALLRATFRVGGVKPYSVIDPLFDAFGPLASFSARIKLAFALNLIDGYIYRDLETLRKLRNIFAHSLEATRFDCREVVQLTEKLEAPNLAVEAMSKQRVEAASREHRAPDRTDRERQSGKAAMERVRVTIAISWIGATLYFRIEHPNSLLHLRMAHR
jgi:DNA-binding MltR family transcriptional regulator